MKKSEVVCSQIASFDENSSREEEGSNPIVRDGAVDDLKIDERQGKERESATRRAQKKGSKETYSSGDEPRKLLVVHQQTSPVENRTDSSEKSKANGAQSELVLFRKQGGDGVQKLEGNRVERRRSSCVGDQ